MSPEIRSLTEADDSAVLALNNVEVPRVTMLDEAAMAR